MYLISIIIVSFIISQVNSQSIDKVIDYYKNERNRNFRKEWDRHRKPIQNAIETALKEIVGVPGMNVYVRKKKETVASGFFHSDNQIKLILKKLRLHTYPRCWLPEVQFSLASNVLKMQTFLSRMIMHADYSLVRNTSDIIYDADKQDPLKASPFLFQPVQDVGRVAISLEGCELICFIIATLNGESVNLGYQAHKIENCLSNIEIFREGDDSPPVIARYNLNTNDHGLSITQLLMRQLNDELLPKLQGAMFSYINTSAVFENKLQEYMENQQLIFKTTSEFLTEVIRNLNKLTIEKNQGVVEMKNYVLYWNSGRFKTNQSNHKTVDEQLTLVDMVLSGLDTVYSSHSGGPLKFDKVMVVEEIRFSSLQVRGYVDVKSIWSDRYSFVAVISDMAADVHLEIQPGPGSPKMQAAGAKYRLKYLRVSNYRHLSFAVPSIIFGSAEALISGYLLNEVPKLITAHLREFLPQALESAHKNTQQFDDNPKLPACNQIDEYPKEIEVETDLESDLNESNSQERKGKSLNTKRNAFKKTKKRFKNTTHLNAQNKAKLRAKCMAMKNAQKFKKYRQ